MRGRRRLIAAVIVAVLCAPGNFLRTELTRDFPKDIALEPVAGPRTTGDLAWEVAGVWRYSTGPTLRFGGFSALLPLTRDRLRAFSDRGFVFTFTEPDLPDERSADRVLSGLTFNDPDLRSKLWDIESVTSDPSPGGDYWVGFEATHAIHRFSYQSKPEAVRMLDDEVDWYNNGGLEAMERLADGRFLALPERKSYALLFPDDPAEAAKAERLAFDNPAPGYAVTDMAQLPDGRILLLMRRVVRGIPPFASLIALADPPDPQSDGAWSPEVILRLEGVLPPENYEGLAVRP